MSYTVGQELYLKRRYNDGGVTVTVEKVGRKYAQCTLGWSVDISTNRLTGIGDQQYEVFASLAAYKQARAVASAKRRVIEELTNRLAAATTPSGCREALRSTCLTSLWDLHYNGD